MARERTSEGLRAWLSMPGQPRVWALTFMIATAAALITWAVKDVPAIGDRITMEWWLVAILVWVGEMTVVHLRFRRDAHSFSMSEIPIIVGLFVVSPLALITAQFVGNAIALAVNRRQTVLKLAFNLSQFTLVTAVQAVIFRVLAPLGDPYGLAGWAAALVAVLVGMLIANSLITAAITFSGGQLERKELFEVAILTALAVAMNGGLGLVVVTIMTQAPNIWWLAFIPPLVLFLSYRAYISQRQERSRLEALYDATRELHRSPQIETALSAAAMHARTMLEAEVAEIVLLPQEGSHAAYRTAAHQSGVMAVMEPSELSAAHWSTLATPTSEAMLLEGSAEDGFSIVASTGDAILASIVGEGGDVVGVLLVSNRLGDTGKFETHDIKLVETLAAQVGVSVQNGRLEDSLAAVTELKEELKHQALHDSLTGLANRTLFAEEVQQAIARAEDGVIAVMFIDLDDFKTVNDSLGHAAGDQLLIVVAERLRQSCRPGDGIARLGGDEFAILLEDLESPATATEVAARLIDDLSLPLQLDGKMVSTHMSVGIAYGTIGLQPDQLLRNADAAMYAAKRSGKATYRVFDPSMHTDMLRRLELRAELKEAIESEQLFLLYQPLMDVSSERMIGVEALVRWQHPKRGVVGPMEFVAFAEESGLIVPLGRWVLDEACRQAAVWVNDFGLDDPEFSVHVNLSPRQLQNASIVHDVTFALERSGIKPEMLTLEITENVLMHSAANRLDDLKALGVRLALDDFGTGYSSLSYLDRFPIDILKIDRSFVERLRDGEDGTLLMRAVLRIAETLGMQSVAEGIETISQLGHLRDMGCVQGQGFLFAKPMAPEKIEPLLDDRSGLSLDRRREPPPNLRVVAG